MSIHTTTHALSDRDSDRLGRDFNSANHQGGTVSPRSTARRAAVTVRRIFREINEANAAVDRVNRPWVYQSKNLPARHEVARRASR